MRAPEQGGDTASLVRIARDSRLPIHEQQAAFARLVEMFEEMAYATAFSACEDIESARDSCQEAFLVAWRKLADLRDPAAFGTWLKRLVRTQCNRSRRKRSTSPDFSAEGDEVAIAGEADIDAADELHRRETNIAIRRAINELPIAERRAIVLFYFLGEPLRGLAQSMGISAGNAGKRVHSARLRLRRRLPRSIVDSFLATAPTPAFTRRVQAGVFAEFEGEYRFPERPDHQVLVRREGALLVSYAGGQRNVLASRKDDVLTATEFDGEARFRRNRAGRITHFAYYEFGHRLGVASKVNS